MGVARPPLLAGCSVRDGRSRVLADLLHLALLAAGPPRASDSTKVWGSPSASQFEFHGGHAGGIARCSHAGPQLELGHLEGSSQDDRRGVGVDADELGPQQFGRFSKAHVVQRHVHQPRTLAGCRRGSSAQVVGMVVTAVVVRLHRECRDGGHWPPLADGGFAG